MFAIALALSALVTAPQEPTALAHEAYRAQLAAAESAMRLGEHADARGWLDAADPARRGFEWSVHDAELDQSLRSWSVDVRVNAIATSPDGRFIGCGRIDGVIELRDTRTFEVRASVAAHDQAITQVRFDRDSGRVLTASYDRTVKVWRLDDLDPVVEFTGHGYPIGGADFSADGGLVASCAYERPPEGVVGTLHLWDASTGELVRTMHGGRKPLVDLWVSPDGSRIAAGSWDFCVFVWDVASGESRKLPVPDEGIYNAVDGVAWGPGGKLVGGASKDRTARVWDAATGELVASLRGHTDDVAKVAFSPNGRLLATASRDGTLRLWNVENWTERATLLGHADDVVGVAFSPDGTRLWSCASDGTVRLWDAETTWYGGASMHATAATYVVRFSPDGHRLASCGYDGRIQIWSADTLELLASWQAHAEDKSCHMLDWSPDGRSLFSGSHDGTVRIWDSVTLQERARLEHDEGLYWLDVSPDGRLAAVVAGPRVHVWDVARRERVNEFAGHGSDVLSVNFGPHSKRCVSSGRDGKAIVWDAMTGEVGFEVTGVGTNVAESVFTPDGLHVIVGGRGGHVALHRADDGSRVRDLVRNRHGFSHLTVSPDGSRVVLASNTVTFVDLRNGEVVGQLRPHVATPYAVAFDPLGQRLASCSTDGSIAVAGVLRLRERLARANAMRRRIEEIASPLSSALESTPSIADVTEAADRLWATPALDSDERAARVAVLTRRAAEHTR